MTPIPSRVDYIGSSGSTKRRSSRRQSGLLSIDTENLAPPRPASPAFGSPIRLEAGRAEEAEEIAAASGNLEVDVEPEPEPHEHDLLPPPLPKKDKRKSKSREKEMEGEREYAVDSLRSRERKRQREDDSDLLPEGTKGKLKDVTNSRAILQPINRNIGELTLIFFAPGVHSGYLTTAIRVPPAVRDQEEVVVSTRTFLVPSSAPSTTSAPLQPPLPPPPEPEPEPALGGRERRARKSVNYAEPKLNTYVISALTLTCVLTR